MAHRLIWQIAEDILTDWRRPYFGAMPYIRAMRVLDTVDDKFGYDSAKSIILYFLANAQTWKGPTAKKIKAELKELINAKPNKILFIK